MEASNHIPSNEGNFTKKKRGGTESNYTPNKFAMKKLMKQENLIKFMNTHLSKKRWKPSSITFNCIKFSQEERERERVRLWSEVAWPKL